MTPELKPETSTGVLLCVAVLSPVLPPAPQHLTPPVLNSAQVWPSPAEIAMTPELKPETFVGELLFTNVPSPSWLELFSPQHCTAPVSKSAQVWFARIEIALTAERKPETPTGVSLCVVVPSPSWPFPFSPQHFRMLELKSVQVWP